MDVLLIDDHPMIHEVMREVVRAVLPEATFHSEKDLEAGLATARKLQKLELALIDLGLPGCEGVDSLRAFRKAFPVVPAVVISCNEDPAVVQEALRLGAAGYLPKTSTPQLLIAALRLVRSGGVYLPPQAIPAGAIIGRVRSRGEGAAATLTDRQADVLRLLMKGLSNREIARRLKITENTVKQHAHAAYFALGVSTRMEAVVAVGRLGLKFE